MASLLYPDDEPAAGPDGMAEVYRAITDSMERQRQQAQPTVADLGLFGPAFKYADNPVGTETTQSMGMPQPTTYAGLVGQYVDPATGQLTEQGQARMGNPLLGFGTGGIGAMAGGVTSGLSLQRVNPRNLRPMSADPDLTVPGSHAYLVRNPAGDHVGTVDTEWDPMMGELHIADLQSNAGAHSFGAAAVKQLRDALLEQYPDARTLSGYRITGSNPNREIFQRLQRDQGRQQQ